MMADQEKDLNLVAGGSKAAPRRTKRGRWSAQEVAEKIVGLIEQGEYHPGDRLREQELVERFGVSRTPVREALRALEAKSLIRIDPMRGATVLRLSDEALQHTLEIRGVLLGLAARRAAQHASPEERENLVVTARELLDRVPSITPSAFAEASAWMATLMVRAARSERLRDAVHLYHQGGPKLFDVLGFGTLARRRRTAAGWNRIADAIDAGDLAGAERLTLRQHQEMTEAALDMLPTP